MKRNILALLLATLMLSAMLVACGEDKDETNPTDTAESVTSQDATATDAEGNIISDDKNEAGDADDSADAKTSDNAGGSNTSGGNSSGGANANGSDPSENTSGGNKSGGSNKPNSSGNSNKTDNKKPGNSSSGNSGSSSKEETGEVVEGEIPTIVVTMPADPDSLIELPVL